MEIDTVADTAAITVTNTNDHGRKGSDPFPLKEKIPPDINQVTERPLQEQRKSFKEALCPSNSKKTTLRQFSSGIRYLEHPMEDNK
ncbi:hypothetical protein AAC387_Pa06g1612 [Persea americana]